MTEAHPSDFDPIHPFATPFRQAKFYFSLTAVVIGVVVLIGWAIGNATMKSVVPGMITMKVNTAAALILLAIASLHVDQSIGWRRVLCSACIVATILLTGAMLCEYAFGVDLRIDNLVLYDYESPRFPGRSAPATSFAFIGLAVAFLLLHLRRATAIAQVLLIFVAAAPLASLGGYLYRAPGMYQNTLYPVIAINTSVGLMLLCLAGLFARPRDALVGIVSSRSLAGSLGRKLLPAAAGVPLLVGLLVMLGQRSDLYSAPFGSALLVACCAAFFAAAVCWTMTLLWNTEQLRLAAETERERLFEAERTARTEAESANRAKDEFLSVVSHELRTPLNNIYGWSQLLRRDTPPDDLAEGLAVIERSARAQRQIIDDLLDMSRIISGRLHIELQATDLHSIVETATNAIRTTAQAKGVRLEQFLSSRAVSIRGDAVRLQQIVWNLLSNAIKFTPPDGSIQIRLEQRGGSVQLVVTDSGEGIDADFLPFVFDRFRQADSSSTRRHGGLGLGLSIVKQLAELHGGSVCAQSEGVGRGCTFTVTLPAAAA